jgi:hypothetical protein
MDPLSAYSERLLEVRREFLLYPDRVVVKARWLLKGRFEHTVRLSTLKGDYRQLVVSYRMFRYAGWALAMGALFFAMMFYEAKGRPLGFWGYLTLGVAVLGAIALALTYPLRRLTFVRFDPKSGRGGLDIGSAGNDESRFRDFVRAVQQQIRRH